MSQVVQVIIYKVGNEVFYDEEAANHYAKNLNEKSRINETLRLIRECDVAGYLSVDEWTGICEKIESYFETAK